ncbi:MAG: hypothetical protein V1679_02235 [Candidatus Peregrinibacteria bacterium]
MEDLTFEDRVKAQQYDLNYLRLFKLDIETDDYGFPIDQSCGKGLTIDDILQINAWINNPRGTEPVYGEKTCGGSNYKCNGINPLEKFDKDSCEGDLVPPKDASKLAKGLNDLEHLENATNIDPVYIYYKAPDSFVFTKGSSVKSR